MTMVIIKDYGKPKPIIELFCPNCVYREIADNRIACARGRRNNCIAYCTYKPGPPWHLDTHSTILSRKHSNHMRFRGQQYVQARKETE